MTTGEPHPRTAAAVQARRRDTEQKLDRVREAIILLRRHQTSITSAAVARRADVSRTFLYENTDARALVTDAMTHATRQRVCDQTERDVQREASWRERALNAEDALNAAYAEIRAQRARLGEFLGTIRDLEQRWSTEDRERITAENSTLKQRVRQLTQDNRTLEERLQAARSNVRFQDRKIAQLEAQLLQLPCESR